MTNLNMLILSRNALDYLTVSIKLYVALLKAF